MDHESMQDELGQAAISVLNGWPDEPLYMVDFMSESEREGLIKDSLPLQTLREVEGLLEQKNAEGAERLHKSVAYQVLQAGMDLMDEGGLPDFRARPQYKKAFLDRTLKTYALVTGDVIPEKIREHISKRLSNTIKGGTYVHTLHKACTCMAALLGDKRGVEMEARL